MVKRQLGRYPNRAQCNSSRRCTRSASESATMLSQPFSRSHRHLCSQERQEGGTVRNYSEWKRVCLVSLLLRHGGCYLDCPDLQDSGELQWKQRLKPLFVSHPSQRRELLRDNRARRGQ